MRGTRNCSRFLLLNTSNSFAACRFSGGKPQFKPLLIRKEAQIYVTISTSSFRLTGITGECQCTMSEWKMALSWHLSCVNKCQGCTPPADSWRRTSTVGGHLQQSPLHRWTVAGRDGGRRRGLAAGLILILNHRHCSSCSQLQSSSWRGCSLSGWSWHPHPL